MSSTSPAPAAALTPSESGAALAEVRRAARKADVALAALEAAILDCRAAGASVRAIADVAGCSHPTVMKIVDGQGWSRPVGRERAR